MKSDPSVGLYKRLTLALDAFNPSHWSDITKLLDQIKCIDPSIQNVTEENYLRKFAEGTAFITFDFGIDGVSIEIAKYAKTLEDIYEPYSPSPLHMIAGDFQPEATSILRDNWSRLQIEGINGWDKWDEGKWFRALFKRQIVSHSQESKALSQEIFKQAVSIAKRLGKYLIDEQISLLIPVNIASNPGNMALVLGVVLVSELLGIHVLNSNHDFYWESGKSAEDRKSGEKIGPRDHFFRNSDHRGFFPLFQSLYPWDGQRWLQVNINPRQTRRLKKRTRIPSEKVQELSTAVDDRFFMAYSVDDVKYARRRMALILADGKPQLQSISIEKQLRSLGDWMADQKPVLVGAEANIEVDPESDNLIILLQPTRIIARKRIERNIDLIRALMTRSSFGRGFKQNSDRQLILHITGPAPKEHQKDLQKILLAYKKLGDRLSDDVFKRIFLAFSVGQEYHPMFVQQGFEPMTIDSIYRMANAVVFPSETEGRGLPIIEASAIGIPIICSRYYPKEVFLNVIGEGLSDEKQIQYTLFPDGNFTRRFLEKVSKILLSSRGEIPSVVHNKAAVKARYSHQALKEKFEFLLEQLSRL
jgi:glycosyltransferase involved in cell wall biosynthesis